MEAVMTEFYKNMIYNTLIDNIEKTDMTREFILNTTLENIKQYIINLVEGKDEATKIDILKSYGFDVIFSEKIFKPYHSYTIDDEEGFRFYIQINRKRKYFKRVIGKFIDETYEAAPICEIILINNVY